MRRKSKKVKSMESFRFSGQTGLVMCCLGRGAHGARDAGGSRPTPAGWATPDAGLPRNEWIALPCNGLERLESPMGEGHQSNPQTLRPLDAASGWR
jgi:hypothetical protein